MLGLSNGKMVDVGNRDNSRISFSRADGAQSKFVCDIFKMCAPYRYIE